MSEHRFSRGVLFLKKALGRSRRPRTKSSRLRIEQLEPRQVLAAPVLPVIADVDLFSGAPVNVALNGSDADGDALAYTVTTSSTLLTGTVIQNSTSLKISVEQKDASGNLLIKGDLIVQLFQDLSPNTVARITQLVNQGFYNGLTFHRVIDNFMIQTGDPTATGSGGSGVKIDDEFNANLRFTGRGVVAMAKSVDDSGDSQLFIATNQTRWLDFNHTIFGFVTQQIDALEPGGDLLNKIDSVPVQPNSTKPVNDVKMTSVSIIQDRQNAVLRLSVPAGYYGSADVTVTASDGTNTSAPQTFAVIVDVDSWNASPFLGAIAPIQTTVGVPVSFQIPATDVENDPVNDPLYYDAAVMIPPPLVGQNDKPDSKDPDWSDPSVTRVNALLSVLVNDAATGQITVTPAGQTAGVGMIFVGVKDANADEQYNSWDTQAVPVYVKPAPPTEIKLLSRSVGGTLTDLNNTADKTLTFQVKGVQANADVELLADGTLIGRAFAPADGTVTIATNGVTTLTDGPHAITARQTMRSQTVSVGNFRTVVDLASAVSSPLSLTIDATAPQFTSTPPTVARVGIPYRYDAQATEEGAGAAYTLVNPPAGMTIDPNTGVVAWTPASGQGTTVPVTIRATDRAGNASDQAFGLTVASNGLSTIGLYNPYGSHFYLKNSNTAAPGDVVDFGFESAGIPSSWIPLIGDWNGDGIETLGLYDPAGGHFYLKNSNSATGNDLVEFAIAGVPSYWVPLAGDWNGDGFDTIGLYDPYTAHFYLKNANTATPGNLIEVNFNLYLPGWSPLVGDWNADGIDTIGLYDPGTAHFYLKNSNNATPGDVTEVNFNLYLPGWRPLVGDWNRDGIDTIGLYDPNTAHFYLKDSNTATPGDVTDFSFNLYLPGWSPLAGDWVAPPAALNAAAPAPAAALATPPLTEAALAPIVQEAVLLWNATSLSAAQRLALQSVQVALADLPGGQLGQAMGNSITIDLDAAGYGWFVDPTPGDNDEFAPSAGSGDQRATDRQAVDRMDLLTVVSHELGHLLGLNDADAAADQLMAAILPTGIRRTPAAADLVLATGW